MTERKKIENIVGRKDRPWQGGLELLRRGTTESTNVKDVNCDGKKGGIKKQVDK